jgi:hypothetical protein
MLGQVFKEFELQINDLKAEINSHSIVLREPLEHQKAVSDCVLRVQCWWRHCLAIRAKFKREQANAGKFIAEAAYVSIQATQTVLTLVGNAVADVAAASARTAATEEWDAMLSSWEQPVDHEKECIAEENKWGRRKTNELRDFKRNSAATKLQAIMRGKLVRALLQETDDEFDDFM